MMTTSGCWLLERKAIRATARRLCDTKVQPFCFLPSQFQLLPLHSLSWAAGSAASAAILISASDGGSVSTFQHFRLFLQFPSLAFLPNSHFCFLLSAFSRKFAKRPRGGAFQKVRPDGSDGTGTRAAEKPILSGSYVATPPLNSAG